MIHIVNPAPVTAPATARNAIKRMRSELQSEGEDVYSNVETREPAVCASQPSADEVVGTVFGICLAVGLLFLLVSLAAKICDELKNIS